MSEVLLTSIISGLSVAIPSIIASVITSKNNKNLIEYKIEELSQHVNKHNNLIDRMYKIENRVTLLEERSD